MNSRISSTLRVILKGQTSMRYIIRNNKTFYRTEKQSFIKQVGANGLFLLVIPIGTFCLGTWQVQRREWKLGLIQELDAKTQQPPIPIPHSFALDGCPNPKDIFRLDELDDLEYQKVKIHGTFDHSQEMFLGPRPLLTEGDVSNKGGGLISSGQSGFNVITPFILHDTQQKILVNRGWIPRKLKNPSARSRGQVEGPIELTAVVRKHEDRAPFMPQNIEQSNVFAYRDVNKMARITDSAPVCLDAVETIEGGPVGSQTRVTLRNEHLSYIITWYSLCLATSFLWYKKFMLLKPLM